MRGRAVLAHVWFGGVIAGAGVGCGHDYSLSPVKPDEPPGALPLGEADDVGVEDLGEDEVTVEIVPVDLDGPHPVEFEEPEAAPDGIVEQEITLGGGVRSEVADYLFVIDGSSSMQRVLGRVLDGFEALAGVGPTGSRAFPSEARIGVMSTLPADPRFRDRVHRAAPDRSWLARLPGFGGLVDGRRIGRFLAVAPPRIADRYPVMGCDAWFAPDEANADGVPCLVANTQIALYPVIVEAGLTALAQRLEADPPLFRSGAAANVIVVSDTHDPGIPSTHPMFEELSELRPTYEALEELALSRQELASFRVHAIAPAEVCTAEDWTGVGPAYFEAARAGGGEVLDVCDANSGQYVELVRRIAEGGAIPTRPVLPLAADAELLEVLIDGEPAEFRVSDDGRAIVLPGSVPAEASQIRVRYRDVGASAIAEAFREGAPPKAPVASTAPRGAAPTVVVTAVDEK
jgi:hypothetical protein